MSIIINFLVYLGQPLDLFAKADMLAAATSQNMKDSLESSFSEIAIEYGFLIHHDDGSTATTNEFNEEYELYCQNGGEYIAGKESTNATSSQAVASDEADTENDFSVAPEDISPSPPTHVDLFPIRDASGDLQAFLPADSYTDALKDYLSQKTDHNSLSIDFESGGVDNSSKKINVKQYGNVTGWDIKTVELTWNTPTSETMIADTSLKASEGNINVGKADHLKAQIDKGTLYFGNDIKDSEIILNKEGTLEVKGDVNDTSIELSSKASGKFRGRGCCMLDFRTS